MKTLRREMEKLPSEKLSEEAEIYLLIANKSKDRLSQVGSTVKENGIVLFKGFYYEEVFNNKKLYRTLAMSTLLHEFGHQLGLDHNEKKECLMNSTTKFTNLDTEDDIVKDFCNYEKDLIRKHRNEL